LAINGKEKVIEANIFVNDADRMHALQSFDNVQNPALVDGDGTEPAYFVSCEMFFENELSRGGLPQELDDPSRQGLART
jgi:hypothetical protein